MHRLTFCDIAMFYCQTGGGIRTYYNAKLDWFRRQDRHRYVLVVPGAHSSTRSITPLVRVVEARGVSVTSRPGGYRLFVDLPYVRSTLRESRPDVLEAGDSWVSGPLALGLRQSNRAPRVVSSFFHADPIPTYVEPALRRLRSGRLAEGLTALTDRLFWRLQARYDATMTSSACLADRLRKGGATNVRCTPFGVDAIFFEAGSRRRTTDRPRRLLYVGRLDRDKQVDLILAALPRLLDDRDLVVTIAGTGAFRSRFEASAHPRLRYVGYVSDRAALAELYADHDILLAPGGYETFGLAALEAAAAGLVIVGPDRGGTGALLGEMDPSFAFRADDAEHFFASIRAALAADWPRASAASLYARCEVQERGPMRSAGWFTHTNVCSRRRRVEDDALAVVARRHAASLRAAPAG